MKSYLHKRFLDDDVDKIEQERMSIDTIEGKTFKTPLTDNIIMI